MRFEKEKQIKILVENFENIFQLEEALIQQFQIFFLDMESIQMKGEEVIRFIRKRDKKAYIIFMDSNCKHLAQNYEGNASRYLIKPISYKVLKNEIKRAMRVLEVQKKEAIVLKSRNSWYKVYLSDIRYIETAGRFTKVYTEIGILETKKRMKEYESILKTKGFVRCHNSYIVNLKYVREIRKFEAILETGERVFISKAKKRMTKEKFIEYIGNMI
ncbi:MAG: LytR/AlgR family response regulator transcription factor [Lachnospiraceae bacterium]